MRGLWRAGASTLCALLALQALPLFASPAHAATGYQLRVSSNAARTSARALDGATLKGAAYVFLTPTTHVARVTYWVDDTHRTRTPRHSDSLAPFDLVGGTTSAARPLWTSTLAEGTHHLTAQVTTRGGRHIVVQAIFRVHNTPPAPATPRTVPGNGKVEVIWHSSGGTTHGFNVYRSTTSPVSRTHPRNGSTPLKSSVTSFVDEAAVNSTKYYYVVVAVSIRGLLSKSSATVSARPAAPAPTQPPAPLSVVATPDSGQIHVQWKSGGGSTDGFNVYRSTSSGVSLSNPRNGTLLPADATSFDDEVPGPGRYYYVVQAVSSTGVRSDPSEIARATFGAAAIELSSAHPVLYTQKQSGTVTGKVRVTNVGDATLTVSDESLAAGHSSYLTLSSPGGFTLAGGEHQDVTFSFTPLASGPRHTRIEVSSDDPTTPVATLEIGGLAIDNTATSEPSLQWILEAYGIAANDGDPNPSTYPLQALSIPPSDGVLVTSFTRRNSDDPVQVTALGAFVSRNPDPVKTPEWGWTPENTTPGEPTVTYDGTRSNLIGTTSTIDPAGTFGLWARIEGTTFRTDLNSASTPRFIAFPVAGSPGTYVLADDTTGRTSDDWNDLPLLITNVSLNAAG
jgi:hypothetical protein